MFLLPKFYFLFLETKWDKDWVCRQRHTFWGFWESNWSKDFWELPLQLQGEENVKKEVKEPLHLPERGPVFVLPSDTVSPSPCKLNSVLYGSTWSMTGTRMMLQSPWFQKEPLCKPEKRFGKVHRWHGGRGRKLFSVSDVGIVALAGSRTCVANPDLQRLRPGEKSDLDHH